MSSWPRDESKPRLRLRLKAAAESRIRAGHPWIFSGSVRDQNRDGEAGELAVIYDRRDQFLAIGLYEPNGTIRVRVLHVGKPETVDRDWWRRRLDRALEARRGLFGDETTGYRLINGENDSWPGLVLDRYGDTLVLKIYTLSWCPFLVELKELIAEALPCRQLILRLSRNIQSVALETFQRVDGMLLRGGPLIDSVIFLETGLKFEAEVVRGQKTGFFLDQRENRQRVEEMSGGREILNAFSFSGGFSVYAARGGARRVLDLDLSAHALEGAKRNFALNRGNPGVEGCVHETVKGDAFEWLREGGGASFDLVVLDPPSLARREEERRRAIEAYGRLAGLALGRLRPKGMLVAASCSAHVTEEEFFGAVRGAARRWGRRFREVRTTGQPPDHPVTFPEGRYLKCIYLES